MADKQPLIYAPRVPELPSVPSPVVQAPPVPELPALRSPQIVGPYKPKQSLYLDYDDPYQLNSIADIILTTFNPNMKRRQTGIDILGNDLSEIPLINMIPSSFQYVNDAYINPMSRNEWGAAALNTLTNFSETLDIFANPVKGAVLDGEQGFFDALGYGGGGRKNYDYDTGNVVEDIALELISDPLNWVTLFGKGAVSSMIKGMARTGLNNVASETGEVLSKQAYKVLTRTIVEGFKNNASVPDAVRAAAEALMKSSTDKVPIQFTEAFLKGLDKLTMDNTTAHVLKGLNGFINKVDDFESGLLKAGIGLPYAASYAMKKAGNAVWEFAHTEFQKGLKQFMTPEGNLDIAKFDAINDYVNRYAGSMEEILEMKWPSEDIKQMYVQEAFLKEKNNIRHFMETDLKELSNVNPEGKVKIFSEYLERQLGVSSGKALEILQDINARTNNQYKWLYDWMSRNLDVEQVKLLEERAKVWDMFHSFKQIKGLNPKQQAKAFEKYLSDNNITLASLLEQVQKFDIVLGPEFKWLEDYFIKTMVYEKRAKVVKKAQKLLKDPKALEGETRIKALDMHVRKEHGMGYADYIALLKRLDEKYKGVFKKHVDYMEAMHQRLQLIDTLEKEYAQKEIAADIAKEKNLLAKEHLDLLSGYPAKAYAEIQAWVAVELAKESVGPARFKKVILKDKAFGKQSLQAYMNSLHKSYTEYVNTILSKLEVPGFIADENYRALMDRFHDIYESYWAKLEPQLRKQSLQYVDSFYGFDDMFRDLPNKLSHLIDSVNPVLRNYNEVIAKADILNKTLEYDQVAKQNVNEFREAKEKLMLFMDTLRNNSVMDDEMKHLQDKIIRLEKISTLTVQDFKAIKSDLSRALFRFFNTGEKVEHISDMVLNWLSKFEGIQTTPVPQFHHEVFASRFDDLFKAIGEDNFKEFLETADQIILDLHALSWPSKAAAEIFRPLFDIFKEYNLGDYKPLVAKLEGEEVWYHFKLEQGYILSLLMSNDMLNKYFKELSDPSAPLGGMLKNLVLTGDENAARFLNSLNSYLNYRRFLNDLYSHVGNLKDTSGKLMDKDMLGAFISTLQKYAMQDPDKLINNLDKSFYWMIKQTEDQMNSLEAVKRFSLDKMKPALEKDPKYADLLSTAEAHHAVDDCKTTWAVVDAELPDEFKKVYGDDVKVVHMDFETNDLNMDVLELKEAGMYSRDLKIERNYVRIPENPGQHRAEVAKSDLAPNCTTELEMYEKMFDELEKLYADGNRNIVINMHNGAQFDRPMMLRNLQRIHDELLFQQNPEAVQKARHIIALINSGKYRWSDSLKMLHQKYNYRVIPEETKLHLYYTLKLFIEQQKGMGKFIQPLDTTIAKQLKEIGKELMETASPLMKEQYREFITIGEEIYSFFRSIKNANRELSRTMLKKSIFDDELFQQAFGLNITQALNTTMREDGTREIISGIKQYGVKTHLDEPAIREYFSPFDELSEYQMEYRTGIAKDIDRERGQLKHTKRLKYHQKHMEDILGKWLEAAKLSGNIPDDLKFLKVHRDYLSNFAILRKLYTYKSSAFKHVSITQPIMKDGKAYTIYADNILDGLVGKNIDADFRHLLENPKLVRTRSIVDDGSVSEWMDAEIRAVWHDVNKLKKGIASEYEAEKAARQMAENAYVQKKAEADAFQMLNTVENFEKVLKLDEYTIEIDKKNQYQILRDRMGLDRDIASWEGYLKAGEDILKSYEDLTEMLEALGHEWDRQGAHRAFVQVRATSLKEMYRLLNVISKRHKELKTVDEQYRQIMKYREVSQALALQQMDNILRLSDEDLFAHLVNDGRRLVVLNGLELNGAQLKVFVARMPVLEEKRIHTFIDEKSGEIYLYLDKEIHLTTYTDELGKVHNLADGTMVPPPVLQPLNVGGVLDMIFPDDADSAIRQHMKEVYDKMFKLVGDYDTNYSPHYGSMGELTNKAYYKEAYEMIPDEVKKMLPHPDIMYADEFFHGGTFNHSILGGAAFRHKFHKYINWDIVSMLTSTMTVQAQHLKSHVEYMNLFFDDMFSITNGEIAKFSDEELLSALKGSSEYRLVALTQDNKFGAKVVDLDPQNISDIKKARELGAVVMAYQTYSKAFGAINTYGMRHSKLNMLHKINYLYKMGYLLSPGTFLRNVIDSVTKNYVMASDDPTGMTKSFYSAWQLYWRYRQTAKELIETGEPSASGGKQITKQSAADYFATGASPLTKEQYDFIHGFDVDGPSGGQIREFEEYFMHGKHMGPVSWAINFMMRPNQVVEQVCRLAEYMWAIEKGMPNTKAYALVAKTHFDYTIKTGSDKLIELIFPFYTFTMNNIHFWLDAFDRIPALASVIRDVYTPIWNLDEHSPEELQYNRSLQYQILSGNLPLEQFLGDRADNMTFKMNPSFMDVYQLATDPVNSVLGKLHPVAQRGLDYIGAGMPEEMRYAYGLNGPGDAEDIKQQLLELLPIAGPFMNRLFEQGPKYYERTGNMLSKLFPSMFGATAESRKFTQNRKAYRPRTYTKKPRRNYTKRPKRFTSFAKKYYPKKVYSSVGYSVDNFYNKLYTKTGKSRLALRSVPVTGQSLKYRIKDMYYYFK